MADKEISFLESESSGFNAALAGLEQLVDADTIFVATHQFGFPSDIVRAVEICHRRGALVIEDCAASLGTRIQGRLAGSFGDAAFFSFDSTKLINVPLKAGFVTVQSPEWFAELQAAFARETGPMPLFHQFRLLLLGAAYLVLEFSPCYRLFHWLTLRKRFTADTSEISLERTAVLSFRSAPLAGAPGTPAVAGTGENHRAPARIARTLSTGSGGLPVAAIAAERDVCGGTGRASAFRCSITGDKLARITPPTGAA